MLKGRYVYFEYNSVKSACRYADGYNWLRKYMDKHIRIEYYWYYL